MEKPGSSLPDSELLELNNSFLDPSPVKSRRLQRRIPISREELLKNREAFKELLEKLEAYERSTKPEWEIEYPARRGAFYLFHPPEKEFLNYKGKERIDLKEYLHPEKAFPAGSPYKSYDYDALNEIIRLEKTLAVKTKEESEAASWYCLVLSCLSDDIALIESASKAITDFSKFDQASFIEILHFWGFKEPTFIVRPESHNIRPFLFVLEKSIDYFPNPPSISFLLLLIEMCLDPKFREEGSLLTKAISGIIRRLQCTTAWTEKLVEFLNKSYKASERHISYLIISFILKAEDESSKIGCFLGKHFLSIWLRVAEPEDLNLRTLTEIIEAGKNVLSSMESIPLYHVLNLILGLLIYLRVENEAEYEMFLPRIVAALDGVPFEDEPRDRYLSVVVEDLVLRISNKDLK